MSSNTESSERKTVTIRGLSVDIYNRISRLAREMGVTVGEIVNEALRRYITTLENVSRTIDNLVRSGDVVVISGISSLTVTKADLESLDKPVVFRDMDELVFADDVTNDLIKNKVAKIVNVNTVYVPKTVSTLLIASKSELVRKIVPK
ncbi:MAG: ribbon-helix-helix domain-containing protein [Vulcanisaeta sp.]|jgi:predicted DNA-binding protein|nr:ribbon-helix-helix domain-containing protein [Vulcanisaeta sp.]MCG2869904.1 ribbon-helix-helix domain-containing protein [Vulcanisaeta sp.]MCG2880269.1 ribbon-helix-helix domain-containing protein [Vulcanisaeta sp.]MCG2887317.1 ribbon-helix-helix domain-containing protein [Vulcanisaeta sp.]MCG2892377.1 ribbon-helix-helix domain-containing protein [Vulcanisaeta sp.]